MTFMYALETLGLSSTAIHWPDFELLEMKMQKTLNLEVDQRPVMLIAFGYPDPEGKIPFSQKKPIEFISDYNNAKFNPRKRVNSDKKVKPEKTAENINKSRPVDESCEA
jgi:hypothetical protein